MSRQTPSASANQATGAQTRSHTALHRSRHRSHDVRIRTACVDGARAAWRSPAWESSLRSGLNLAETWESLSEGRPAIGPIQGVDCSGLRFQNGAQVRGYDPLKHFEGGKDAYLDRFAQFSVVAAREALQRFRHRADAALARKLRRSSAARRWAGRPRSKQDSRTSTSPDAAAFIRSRFPRRWPTPARATFPWTCGSAAPPIRFPRRALRRITRSGRPSAWCATATRRWPLPAEAKRRLRLAC